MEKRHPKPIKGQKLPEIPGNTTIKEKVEAINDFSQKSLYKAKASLQYQEHIEKEIKKLDAQKRKLQIDATNQIIKNERELKSYIDGAKLKKDMIMADIERMKYDIGVNWPQIVNWQIQINDLDKVINICENLHKELF